MTHHEVLALICLLAAAIILAVFGARAHRAASDRAQCILSIRNYQTAVRSYAGMNEVADGARLEPGMLIGPRAFLHSMPVCPAGGNYIFRQTYSARSGEIFVVCSLSQIKRHRPQDRIHSW